MSTNSQDQEIDLGQIGTGIKNFFNGIVNSIFDFIFFVKNVTWFQFFIKYLCLNCIIKAIVYLLS